MSPRIVLPHLAARGWLVVVVGMASCGCEKLPWTSSSSSTHAAPSASTPSGTTVPSRPAVLPLEIVAKVNSAVISKRDVELALQEARATVEAAGGTWKPLSTHDDPDQYDLPDLLNDLVTVELRAQDALTRGLDRSPEAQQSFAYLYRTFFAQQWLRWQLDRIKPTPEEISQFYNENKAGFRNPERIRIRQLIVDSEDKAKVALVKLLEGVDFVELAQQVSSQPAAAQGPLVDKWVMRSVEKAAFAPDDQNVRELLDPALEQAAFAIDKEGGLSHYVKGPDGKFHIFQLVKREAGHQKELVEVSDAIRNHLRLKKLNDLTDELKAKAQIERFSERLEGVSQ